MVGTLSQVEHIRCRKCGKRLYSITIPTEIGGTLVITGGTVDSKCPRCGTYESIGFSEIFKVVEAKQKIHIVIKKTEPWMHEPSTKQYNNMQFGKLKTKSVKIEGH